MDEDELLAQRFAEHRDHLRAVGYRMLGSLSEADDAVQEACSTPAAPVPAVSRTSAGG